MSRRPSSVLSEKTRYLMKTFMSLSFWMTRSTSLFFSCSVMQFQLRNEMNLSSWPKGIDMRYLRSIQKREDCPPYTKPMMSETLQLALDFIYLKYLLFFMNSFENPSGLFLRSDHRIVSVFSKYSLPLIYYGFRLYSVISSSSIIIKELNEHQFCTISSSAELNF